MKHQTAYEDIPAAKGCFPKGPADHLQPGPTTAHHPPKKTEEAHSLFTAEKAKAKRLQKKLGPRDGCLGARLEDLRLQQADAPLAGRNVGLKSVHLELQAVNVPADLAHSRRRGALVV